MRKGIVIIPYSQISLGFDDDVANTRGGYSLRDSLRGVATFSFSLPLSDRISFVVDGILSAESSC